MEKKDIETMLSELEAKMKTALTTEAKAEIKSQIEALEAKIPDVKELKETVADFKKQLEEKADADKKNQEALDEVLIKMKDMKTGNPTDPQEAFAAELKAKKAEVKAAIKNPGKEVEFKADTLRASIATNNHYAQIGGVGQLARVRRSLYNVFPKVPVSPGNHQGNIAYMDWDEASISKAAAMVAEGDAFPESTAAFKGYTLSLRKVGDSLPVSYEFMEDEQMAAAELSLFVSANVESKIDDQIVNGDNTGQNLKGLLTTVTAYTAAASSIVAANLYDLIIKMKESITKTKGSKYDPDFAAMNETLLNTLVLKKDANDQYLFPLSHPIYSMIVVDNNIANDTLVVGDSRFARIYEMGGITISRGEVNAQFTEDMETIKVRKRLAFLIREADKGGFTKSTQVATDITTLASS